MRRSACWLTILGLSLNTVAAQDAFGPAQVPSKPTGTSLQYYGTGASSRPAESQSIQRYQRSTTESVGEVPNYYNDLFGQKSEATETRTRLKPAGPQSEENRFATEGQVIQAGHETNLATQGSQIQQVRADGRNARPFPGQLTSAPQVPAALEFNPAKPSLTTPVQMETREANATAASREIGTSGSVTFSQGRLDRAATVVAPTVATISAVAGPQTPSVTIEWKQHSVINVGQECACDLVIKNTGKSDALGVEVEATFPATVRLLEASPKPEKSETFLGWQFGELKAGEERVITIKMIPMQRGSIATQANVRFTGSASGIFDVSEPLLSVSVKGQAQVMVGESAPQTIVVTNPGSGVTSNVQIEAIIPDGLEHARGKRLLMEIGSLNPGESRNIRLAMIAVAGGPQQIQVQARADAGLLEKSVATVSVIAPSLNATIDGPGLRYLGRQGRFKLTVANDGAAATSNVQVMHKIPQGFEFVSADRGVQYDQSTRLMTWFVGRLDEGEKSEIEVTLLAKQIGDQKHLVRATSEHGSLSDADFTTRIEGTSSLSLEVVDLDDPVELGTEAIYEVRVKNEGTASARDVGLACELTKGVNFVSAEGPAAYIEENGIVTFRTIPDLGPGKTATYRVRVASTTIGNTRFRARATSESVAEPLTADELTKFYGE